MSNNKNIFANNLKRYISDSGKTRSEICNALDIKYSTFSEWVNGNKYPRMDKVEILADYFGVNKSDLIEEPRPISQEEQEKSHLISKVASRMITDKDFYEVVEDINSLDQQKLNGVKTLIAAFKQ